MSWFRKNKQKTPHPIELANTNNKSKTALSKYNSNDTANYPVNSLLEDEASPPSFYPEGCCEDLCELSYTNSKTCCCVNNSVRYCFANCCDAALLCLEKPVVVQCV